MSKFHNWTGNGKAENMDLIGRITFWPKIDKKYHYLVFLVDTLVLDRSALPKTKDSQLRVKPYSFANFPFPHVCSGVWFKKQCCSLLLIDSRVSNIWHKTTKTRSSNPRTAGGRLPAPLRFFVDSEKTNSMADGSVRAIRYTL